MSDLEALRGSTYRHEGTFDGTPLTVTYLLDDAEHETRARAGRREIRDEFLLAALLSVPVDQLAQVTPRFARALRDAANRGLATTIEDPDGTLWAQRIVEPAVTVQHIDITARPWARGRDIAHMWAGYGPRTVHVRSADTFTLTEASHYGIGVSTDNGQLLAPAPYRPQRWSSARWRFAELVYGQYLAYERGSQ